MLTRRIIPCLDVKDNRVVKGVNFLNLRDAGDPVELGARYSDEGADELVFLDITATIRFRKTIVELVEKVAENVFIPFTVGGGIQTVEQIDKLLRSGGYKVNHLRYLIMASQYIYLVDDENDLFAFEFDLGGPKHCLGHTCDDILGQFHNIIQNKLYQFILFLQTNNQMHMQVIMQVKIVDLQICQFIKNSY